MLTRLQLLTVAGGVAMIIGAQMDFMGGHTLDVTEEQFLHMSEERQIMLEKVNALNFCNPSKADPCTTV